MRDIILSRTSSGSSLGSGQSSEDSRDSIDSQSSRKSKTSTASTEPSSNPSDPNPSLAPSEALPGSDAKTPSSEEEEKKPLSLKLQSRLKDLSKKGEEEGLILGASLTHDVRSKGEKKNLGKKLAKGRMRLIPGMEMVANRKKLIPLLNLIKQLKRPTETELKKMQVKVGGTKNKKTIIFDLEGTLVCKGEEGNIMLRDSTIQVLTELKNKSYDLWIFTSENKLNAIPLVRAIDPDKKFFSQFFFRENCYNPGYEIYVRDLRIFKDRNVKNMLVISHNFMSFAFQLDNGILVSKYNGEEDFQLPPLLLYLKDNDVPSKFQYLEDINKKHFGIGEYYNKL